MPPKQANLPFVYRSAPTPSHASATAALQSGQGGAYATHDMPHNVLRIDGIPPECDERVIVDLFHRYGSIQDLHIVRDMKGFPSGTALLTYHSSDVAHAALRDVHDKISLSPSSPPLHIGFAYSPPSYNVYKPQLQPSGTEDQVNLISPASANTEFSSPASLPSTLRHHNETGIPGTAYPTGVTAPFYNNHAVRGGAISQSSNASHGINHNAPFHSMAPPATAGLMPPPTTLGAYPSFAAQHYPRASPPMPLQIASSSPPMIVQQTPPQQQQQQQQVGSSTVAPYYPSSVPPPPAASPVTTTSGSPPGYSCFVGNIPPDMASQYLEALFASFLPNSRPRVRIHKDRRYAFVTLESAQAAFDAARLLNGYQVGDRLIKVEVTQHEPKYVIQQQETYRHIQQHSQQVIQQLALQQQQQLSTVVMHPQQHGSSQPATLSTQQQQLQPSPSDFWSSGYCPPPPPSAAPIQSVNNASLSHLANQPPHSF